MVLCRTKKGSAKVRKNHFKPEKGSAKVRKNHFRVLENALKWFYHSRVLHTGQPRTLFSKSV